MSGPIIFQYGADEGSATLPVAAWGLGDSVSPAVGHGPYPTQGTYYGTGRTVVPGIAPHDFDTGASSFTGAAWVQANNAVIGTAPPSAGIHNRTYSLWYSGAGNGPLLNVQGSAEGASGTSAASGRGDNLTVHVSSVDIGGGFTARTFTARIWQRSRPTLSDGGFTFPRGASPLATNSFVWTQPGSGPVMVAVAHEAPPAGTANTARLGLWINGSGGWVTRTGTITANTHSSRCPRFIQIGGESATLPAVPPDTPGVITYPTTTNTRISAGVIDSAVAWGGMLSQGQLDALAAGDPYL